MPVSLVFIEGIQALRVLIFDAKLSARLTHHHLSVCIDSHLMFFGGRLGSVMLAIFLVLLDGVKWDLSLN